MAMTINTNVVSLNAQRNLGLSASSLSTTMQRLSSGLRVNSAKDDAAGLAIAERMSATTKGLAVAARNANDGISLAQTAEGALGKVGDMLQRARELAVQASNATNSDSDRKAMQAEVGQLVSEIDRVAKTTSFNGKKLLDGSFAGAVFQTGASAGDNISVASVMNATTAKMSSATYATSADVAVTTGTAARAATGLVKLDVGGTKVDLGTLAAAGSDKERVGQVAALINAKTADTGVTAFISADGTKLNVMSEKNVVVAIEGVDTKSTPDPLAAADFGLGALGLTTASAAAATGIDKLDIGTQAGAWKAIKHLDSAIDQINTARGDLGALQTRFEKTVENIDIQNENIKAARGRIVDADFATETANLSRAQILQQAGTAMVAQANQLPQNVLSLLR